ncbi:hypothetical protein [Marinactinospora rubrisoli]|uniref:Immunity protein 35 domain-containing protein n=1 Tax=Marinactinospora rubrisoli TaxID=2715399 RepID=A0ABW2KD72_9ACTN
MPSVVTISTHRTTVSSERRLHHLSALVRTLQAHSVRALLSVPHEQAPILYLSAHGHRIAVVAAQSPTGWVFLWPGAQVPADDVESAARQLAAFAQPRPDRQPHRPHRLYPPHRPHLRAVAA